MNLKWLVFGFIFVSVFWAQNEESKITLKLKQLQNNPSAVKESYKLLDELIAEGEPAAIEMLKVLEKPNLKIEVQRYLMEALAQIKTEKALETFKKSASAEDMWIRSHGIAGLSALKKEQELVSAGLASPNAVVKEASLRGLSAFNITWEKTPNSVLEALESGDIQLIASACYLLKRVHYSGDPDFFVSCSNLLKKDNLPLELRLDVLQTVAHFPREEAINLMNNTFDREQSESLPLSDNEKYWLKLTILNLFHRLASQPNLTLLQKESVLEVLKKATVSEQALLRAKAYSLIFTLFPQEKELLKKTLEDTSPLVQIVGIQQIPKWGEADAKPLLLALTKKSLDPESQNDLVQSLSLLGMKEEEVRGQLGQISVQGKWYPKHKAERLMRLEEEIQKSTTHVLENSLPQVTLYTEHGNLVIELFENEAKDAVWHFLTCVADGRLDNYLLEDMNVSYLTFQLPSEMLMDYTVKGKVVQQPIVKGMLLMVADEDEDFGGRRFRLYLDNFENFQNKTFTFIGKIVEGIDTLKELSIGDRVKKAKVTRLSRPAQDPALGGYYFSGYSKLKSDYFRTQAEKAYNAREDLKAERFWKKALELQPDDVDSLKRLFFYYFNTDDMKNTIETLERLARKLTPKALGEGNRREMLNRILTYCAKMRQEKDLNQAQKDRVSLLEQQLQALLR